MFADVLNLGLVTSVNVDTNQSDKLLRLLDTVVIKLEGGTEEDLKVLDEKPNIEHKPIEIPKETTPANTTSVPTTTSEDKQNANENSTTVDTGKSEGEEDDEDDDDENKG